MRKLLIASLFVSVSTAAFADIDHSQLVNFGFAGTGTIAGANLSMLETGETTFGFGCTTAANNTLADDFTVGSGGVTVTGISVFTYLTGATTPTVTAVSYALGAAPTTTLTAASSFTNAFMVRGGQAVYRVNAGDTGSTGGIRRIQQTDITGLNINLAAGTQFLSFQITGTSFSPMLPTSLAVYGQNAQQSLAGAAFAPLVNGTGGGDMAFIIHTAPVPEPATMAVLGFGLIPFLKRRRRQK